LTNAIGGTDFEITTTNKIPAVKTLRTIRFETTHEHADACQTGRPAWKNTQDISEVLRRRENGGDMILFWSIDSGARDLGWP